MQDISSNNNRIAKNTVFMYIRMFITMSISLYTSRVLLRTLGVEDYGLFNVVAGIIAMFGFLNGAMTNTTSRYITFYLGKGNLQQLNNVFSMAFIIHAFIAVIIVLLGETVGLWYLYEKLVVPDGRFDAAMWLYQLTIMTTVINILYVPYNSSIVAHEKMSTFAYISIMDYVLKLIVVLSLYWVTYDKLIYYGTLMALVPIINILVYYIYCRKHFKETKIHWFWDTRLFREMFGFAGWSLLGNFSYIFYTQGVNLMLNAFCGTGVNAARAVAVQIEGVVRQFASNVQTALNPQIIKSYAEGNLQRMFDLITASSKYCFYLLFLLSFPIMLEADYILTIWLGEYPEHTVSFVRLILIIVLLDGMVNPMFIANLATGKVKIYQITVSIIAYGFMPITYLAMRFSGVPETVFVCQLFSSIVAIIARVFIMRNQISFPIKLYVRKIVLPNIEVCGVASILPIYIHSMVHNGLGGFLVTVMVAVCSVCVSVYFLGMTNNERKLIISKAKNYIKIRK